MDLQQMIINSVLLTIVVVAVYYTYKYFTQSTTTYVVKMGEPKTGESRAVPEEKKMSMAAFQTEAFEMYKSKIQPTFMLAITEGPIVEIEIMLESVTKQKGDMIQLGLTAIVQDLEKIEELAKERIAFLQENNDLDSQLMLKSIQKIMTQFTQDDSQTDLERTKPQ